MLIKLVEMPSKNEVYFDASQVRAVQHSATNPLVCIVITNFLTAAGFQSFECLGSAPSIACEVNQAKSGKNLLMQ